jgi:type I restriction enzyme R subunit
MKKAGNGEPLGFEQKLWAAADTMRGHMDPAEYQHVVLGLEDGKRRFVEAVTALGKTFSLAVPHADALRIRDEVADFQTVRAALMKTEVGRGASDEELDLAVRQIVSKAVSTDEVVDVFRGPAWSIPTSRSWTTSSSPKSGTCRGGTSPSSSWRSCCATR